MSKTSYTNAACAAFYLYGHVKKAWEKCKHKGRREYRGRWWAQRKYNSGTHQKGKIKNKEIRARELNEAIAVEIIMNIDSLNTYIHNAHLNV